MKKLILTAVFAVSSLASAASWDIDSAHASAGFTVKHLGISNVSGTLGTVSGKFETDDKDLTKSKIDVSIDVKGVNTGTAKRDEHLRSPDFFDVEKFPTATFKSTKLEKGSADGKLKITGDLTLHGVTKPVTFEADLSPEVDHPFVPGGKVRAVSAAFTINREDWGLTWNKPLANNSFVVSKEVKVALELEVSRKGDAPPAAKTPAAAPAKK